MTQALTSVIRFFVMAIGNTMNSHETFVENLKQSLYLTEVYSERDCKVIIAFVSIVSRAGTDIEAALQKIPATRPVVLVTLHHTFDEYYVAPDSRLHVRNRSDVFAVDCLHHEDLGLLRCLRNDEALMAVKQHLRDRFPGRQVMQSHSTYRIPMYSHPNSSTQVMQNNNSRRVVILAVVIVFVIVIILIVILCTMLK